jgi:hypothetical protein
MFTASGVMNVETENRCKIMLNPGVVPNSNSLLTDKFCVIAGAVNPVYLWTCK